MHNSRQVIITAIAVGRPSASTYILSRLAVSVDGLRSVDRIGAGIIVIAHFAQVACATVAIRIV